MLTKEIVLAEYQRLPFERHPLWRSVLDGSLSKPQIIAAETQHHLRSRIGRAFRKQAAQDAAAISTVAHQLLTETYREECLDTEAGPSHLALIERLLVENGITQSQLENVIPTRGNAAAIALYRDISLRGPLHHMIGAGAVKFYYSLLSPRIFEAYVSAYGFSPEQAETYRIHGPMDLTHAQRAFDVLQEPYAISHADSIAVAARDAFVATSLHYDGMLEAATGNPSFWDGR